MLIGSPTIILGAENILIGSCSPMSWIESFLIYVQLNLLIMQMS